MGCKRSEVQILSPRLIKIRRQFNCGASPRDCRLSIGQYRSNTGWQSHPLITQISPIFSSICAICYICGLFRIKSIEVAGCCLEHLFLIHSDKLSCNPSCLRLSLHVGVVRSRWASWSSKPVAGRVAGRGGFDSHPLPSKILQGPKGFSRKIV